jgi:predicted O-methyltransferase YrrM
MRSLGWHASVRRERSIDQEGNAKPWYTYAALEWLAPRVRATDRVFEFGGGYSTVWYGQHASEVVTVEHDRLWLDQVRPRIGKNVTLLQRDAAGNDAEGAVGSRYYSAIEEYPANSFDIIVIDGKERVPCSRVAPSRLRDGGIIIFDNSDRPAFRPGIDHLHAQGFGRIDFYGFVAGVGTRNCTSILSKQFDGRWAVENVPLIWQGW